MRQLGARRHLGNMWRLPGGSQRHSEKQLGGIWELPGSSWRLLEPGLRLRGSRCLRERKSCIPLS